ncbi:MAG: TIGR04086 family membrane protein [Clostridia bacterium]|nr:TIGR04086 family membrane protein [Clostridia bacterium]
MEKENILKANIVAEESEMKKKVMAIIKGCLFAIILSIILLTIYALLLANTTISENTMMPVVLTITGISILMGGTISSRKMKKNGLIYGGIVGLVYVLALYVASSISMVGFSLSGNSFIMLIVGVITGIIGGIIGVNLVNKK